MDLNLQKLLIKKKLEIMAEIQKHGYNSRHSPGTRQHKRRVNERRNGTHNK